MNLKILGIVLVALLVGSCSKENLSVSNENVRLKQMRFKSAGTSDFEIYDFEYDLENKLTSIRIGSSEVNYEYDANGRLSKGQKYRYFYNDFGSIWKASPLVGNDSIIIEYNNQQQAIRKTHYIDIYEQITTYTYINNQVAETHDYILQDGVQVFNSFRFSYEYENHDVIQVSFKNFDENDLLLSEGVQGYRYLDTPNPIKLVQAAFNIESDLSFIDISSFFPGLTITLGDIITLPYRTFPAYNIETIQSVEGNPNTNSFQISYTYETQELGYPTYIKTDYSDSFGRTGTTEYFWEYEAF